MLLIICKSLFHTLIMKSWNKFYKNTDLYKTIEILDQNILYNQLIKIDNKHITGAYLGVKCRQLQTLKIKDIIDENRKLFNSVQTYQKLGIPVNDWNWNI